MDGEDSQGSPLPPRVENRAQVDNALRAIHQKKPVPEIDFTLHTMEDGTQVSTMERVCKGSYPYSHEVSSRHLIPADLIPSRRSSTCNAAAERSAILLRTRFFEAQSPIPEAALL